MIAGEYVFPVRSLAPARSLLPHSLRGAWACAVFPSSFFRCPIRGKETSMMAWRFCVSSVDPFIVSSYLVSSRAFLVHPCRSKQAAAFLIRLVSRLSSRPASRPSVSFSCRLASRPVPRLVPSCPMCRTACLPSCGRAVLFSSSCRSHPCLAVLSSPHDQITQAGQRPPHAPGADKHGANEPHAHRNDTDSTPPSQERLITYQQDDKTDEKKRDGQARRHGKTTRRDEGTAEQGYNETPPRNAIRRNETSKQDETMKRDERRNARRDEMRTIRASNKTTG